MRKALRGKEDRHERLEKSSPCFSGIKGECKYHVVILPKYRKKVLYGKVRCRIGEILRDLCRQKGVQLEEGKAMPDHIHILLSVPPM